MLATCYSTFLNYLTPLSGTRVIFTIFFLVFLFLYLLMEKKPIVIKLPKTIFSTVIYSIVILLISSFFVWSNFYSINMYIGFFLACTVYFLDEKFYHKILIGTFFLQLLLQFYEYFSVSYLYEAIVTAFGYEFEITLENAYLLRTKGLFEGPLTASAFAIYVAYIFRYNPLIISLTLVSTILANTRTGMITTTLVLSGYVFFNLKIFNLKNLKIPKTLIYTLFLAILFVFYFFVLPMVLSEASLLRLQDVANFENESNFKRVLYWNWGWNFFKDYNFINFLFGCSQCFGMEYVNSAESDWIMLLLELGVLGFTIYALPIIFILYNAIIQKNYYLIILMLLLILNIFVYRQISGSATVLLHWLLIFSCLNELKNFKQTKIKLEW